MLLTVVGRILSTFIVGYIAFGIADSIGLDLPVTEGLFEFI